MLAACVLVALAGLTPSASATIADGQTPPQGGVGLRLLEIPTSESGDPRAQLYIIDHVAPGTTFQRRIEISNTTGDDADVSLYSGAASIDAGTFLGADAHTANELSTWTSVTPDVADLAVGARDARR